MAKSPQKAFHTGTVKKTIKIKASKDKVWKKISNIVGLPSWLVDVTKLSLLQHIKKIFLKLKREIPTTNADN